MKDFKLANVVFSIPLSSSDAADLCFRSNGEAAVREDGSLGFLGEVDFFTYFNAFSLSKWCRYTSIESPVLRLKTGAGAFTLHWKFACENGRIEECGKVAFECADGESVELPVPEVPGALVGFSLESTDPAVLEQASYHASVEEASVRDVRIALCTTTFKKEKYIAENIQTVRDEILESPDDISRHFHMYVVDNGKTLDASALSEGGVTVLPNENVGGSGGFARGMIAALEGAFNPTHVLLMDDDVRMSSESFKRVFALLSLVNDEYKDAFVEGAMLKMEDPTLQFEDVSYVDKSGVYDRVKPDLRMSSIQNVVKSEMTSVEVSQAYGAWWYCCIPVAKIRDHGLPLPLFVRCDDVEYGMRCQPIFMTLNGICVWHEGFGGRFRAAVDCYLYVRNFLILIAVDQSASERLFLERTKRNLRIYLRLMSYDAADLILDGWEDYLKGPSFLKTVDGANLLKEKSKKNERLSPVGDLNLEAPLPSCDDRELDPDWQSSLALKLWRMLPYDRHLLPDWLLRSGTAAVCVSGCAKPSSSTVARRCLVALDADRKHGAVRVMDRERYREIKKRWRSLEKRQRMLGAEISREWHAARGELTSLAFWKAYLGLDGQVREPKL